MGHRALVLSSLVLAAAALPVGAAAQDGWNHGPAKQLVDRVLPADSLARDGSSRAFPAPLFRSAVVVESEPNDTITTAPFVSLNDTISGAINPALDFDYFPFLLDSGDVVISDMSAIQLGSFLRPEMRAFLLTRDTNALGEDSITVFVIEGSITSDDPDPRIIFQAPFAGEYVIGVRDTLSQGSPNHLYTIELLEGVSEDNEPFDDEIGNANLLEVGDTKLAFLNRNNDTDFYRLDIPAQTLIEFDIDALDVRSRAFVTLRLFAEDQVTLLGGSNFFFDPRVTYFAEAAQTVYLRVRDAEGLGGPSFFYFVNVNELPLGPGDPPTLYSDAIGFPSGMAAGGDGEIYYIDKSPSGTLERLVRIDPDGSATVLSDTIRSGRDVAVDGFGDLLVPGFVNGDGKIFRIDSNQNVTEFAGGIELPGNVITIGPDGGVWIHDDATRRILEFSPFGERVDSVDASILPLGVYDMAFSPDGILHFTGRTNLVYRVIDGEIEVALTGDPPLEGIVFDRDGFLYVSNSLQHEVVLYSPTYQVVEQPFVNARNGGPNHLVFARNADGSMSDRLIISNTANGIGDPWANALVLANPAGVRAPGFRVGVDLLLLTSPLVDSAQVGAPYSLELSVEGDVSGTEYSIIDGELPAGLELDGNDGLIEGVPQQRGEFTIRLRAESGPRFGEGDLTISVSAPVITAASVVDGLLGVPGILTPEIETFLDIQGNQNGIFDVGDARAYLVATGTLQTLPPAVQTMIVEGGAR